MNSCDKSASELQLHDKRLPFLLKGLHVWRVQRFHEGLVTSRIGFLVGDKVVVELREFALFLQVVAQVASLGVVRTFVVAIELAVRRTGQFFERWNRARFDCPLQSAEPPVGATDDVLVALAALFVKRSQSFIEPGRAFRKIGTDERVNDFVYQRAAAGGDVHDQCRDPRPSNSRRACLVRR